MVYRLLLLYSGLLSSAPDDRRVIIRGVNTGAVEVVDGEEGGRRGVGEFEFLKSGCQLKGRNRIPTQFYFEVSLLRCRYRSVFSVM